MPLFKGCGCKAKPAKAIDYITDEKKAAAAAKPSQQKRSTTSPMRRKPPLSHPTHLTTTATIRGSLPKQRSYFTRHRGMTVGSIITSNTALIRRIILPPKKPTA